VASAKAWHWCRVDVAGPKLALQAIDVDGRVLDTLELRHEAGSARLAQIRAFAPQRAARIDALLR
jgi:hypothetical protein